MNLPVKPIDTWSRGIRRRLLVESNFESLHKTLTLETEPVADISSPLCVHSQLDSSLRPLNLITSFTVSPYDVDRLCFLDCPLALMLRLRDTFIRPDTGSKSTRAQNDKSIRFDKINQHSLRAVVALRSLGSAIGSSSALPTEAIAKKQPLEVVNLTNPRDLGINEVPIEGKEAGRTAVATLPNSECQKGGANSETGKNQETVVTAGNQKAMGITMPNTWTLAIGIGLLMCRSRDKENLPLADGEYVLLEQASELDSNYLELLLEGQPWLGNYNWPASLNADSQGPISSKSLAYSQLPLGLLAWTHAVLTSQSELSPLAIEMNSRSNASDHSIEIEEKTKNDCSIGSKSKTTPRKSASSAEEERKEVKNADGQISCRLMMLADVSSCAKQSPPTWFFLANSSKSSE